MIEATLLLKLAFLVIMLVSMVGVFIPIIPALNIIWLSSLVYGILTGFNWVKIVLMVLLTVLMIVGNLSDNVLMGAKARQKGASWWALAAALAAAIIFSLLLPPFGGIVAALLALFGVPWEVLPDIVPSSGVVALTDREHLGASLPIAGIAGDQQAALFGQACLSPGMAKNTYGTGSFVLLNVGAECPAPVDGLLTTVAWEIPTRVFDDVAGPGGADGSDGSVGSDGSATVTHYALEGAIFVTGAAVQWLRDGLGIIAEASEVGPLAASVDDTGGVFVVPAFAGLGAPDWDPYARGTVVGITRGTTRAHIARAVVEAMAFQTRDVVRSMTDATGVDLAELRVDGGAAAMDLLLQVQADQLGVPVVRSAVAETTALGAALLAGLGAGVWSSAAELAANWRADARVPPSTDPERLTAADAGHRMWRRAVTRSLAWADGG